MISAVICVFLRWIWHLYNLPCVSVLFWLIFIARFVFKSPSIFFRGTKYDINCEHDAYSHYILWRRARRLWSELFASTVCRFLSQISYLSSYVYLGRRRSFTSREILFYSFRMLSWIHNFLAANGKGYDNSRLSDGIHRGSRQIHDKWLRFAWPSSTLSQKGFDMDRG